jgi:hypothetical protein
MDYALMQKKSGIQPMPKNIEAIKNMVHPKTRK